MIQHRRYLSNEGLTEAWYRLFLLHVPTGRLMLISVSMVLVSVMLANKSAAPAFPTALLGSVAELSVR